MKQLLLLAALVAFSPFGEADSISVTDNSSTLKFTRDVHGNASTDSLSDGPSDDRLVARRGDRDDWRSRDAASQTRSSRLTRSVVQAQHQDARK